MKYTAWTRKGGKIKCENLLHWLCKNDHAEFIERKIKYDIESINYICYPRSPLELCASTTAIELLPLFEHKAGRRAWRLIQEMKIKDLKVILGLPDE